MTAAKKILLVFGTRPEAIKMAPVVKKLQELPRQFMTVVLLQVNAELYCREQI